MELDSLVQLSSVAKDIVLSMAVLIGGGWTLYTFSTLKARYRAELENKEIERKLRQQALIDVGMETSQQSIPGDESRYISIIVNLRNEGTRDVRLEFGEQVLAVTKVIFNQQGKIKVTEIDQYPYIVLWGEGKDVHMHNYPYHMLEARTAFSVPFFVRVSDPGLYLVQFKAPFFVGPEKWLYPIVAGAETQHEFGMQCHKFIVVK